MGSFLAFMEWRGSNNYIMLISPNQGGAAKTIQCHKPRSVYQQIQYHTLPIGHIRQKNKALLGKTP